MTTRTLAVYAFGIEDLQHLAQVRGLAGLVADVLPVQPARAVNDVNFMLAHPDTLADPALLDRAVAANRHHPD